MGSLFYINVPTRSYEAFLRQSQLSVLVVKEADTMLRGLVNPQRRGSIVNSIGSRSGSDIKIKAMSDQNVTKSPPKLSIPDKSDQADVYEGMIDGKKIAIKISQDFMAIFTVVEGKDGTKVIPRKYDPDESPQETNISNTFLEKHLEDSLKKFKIYDSTWGLSIDENFSQISFTVQHSRSEEIINAMVSLGIGTKYDSTLSVCTAVVYYNPNKAAKTKTTEDEEETLRSRFVSSIKSRLTVAQVVQTVQANAVMTFDYIMLIIIAAIIAGIGLLDNSPVSLVASMLISPLMGPIMAGCFGTVIRDLSLIKTGVISELIGLTICLFMGFIIGIAVQWAPFPGPWNKVTDWPTNEMLGRGRLRGVIVGGLIAIPSGAGVALSILAGNAGSLVGVAISASLLPPAVNCGVFWGMALVISIAESIAGHVPLSKECDDQLVNHKVYRITRSDYKRSEYYCDNIIREYAILGIVSFGLTVLNIVLILLSGFCVLKIKEVAPHTTRTGITRFWKTDIRVMRNYNKTHGGTGFNKQDLLDEIGGSEEVAEIKETLANDMVFNQVTKRNVFGDVNNVLDVSSIQEEPKLTFWGRIFGGKKKSELDLSRPGSGASAQASGQKLNPSPRIRVLNEKQKMINFH